MFLQSTWVLWLLSKEKVFHLSIGSMNFILLELAITRLNSRMEMPPIILITILEISVV